MWTSQEIANLKELMSQKLPLEDMSSKLGRSDLAVEAKIRRLGLTGNSKTHETRPTQKMGNLAIGDSTLKEFLSAASLLYPSHKAACAFLLREASNRILET